MCAIFLLAAIKCQASIRRGLATKEVENLRQLRRVASATVIQANWRAYEAMTYYKQIKHDVTSLQATVRKLQAMKFLNKYKRAATNIACAWRRRCCSIKFTRAIEGMLITLLYSLNLKIILIIFIHDLEPYFRYNYLPVNC